MRRGNVCLFISSQPISILPHQAPPSNISESSFTSRGEPPLGAPAVAVPPCLVLLSPLARCRKPPRLAPPPPRIPSRPLSPPARHWPLAGSVEDKGEEEEEEGPEAAGDAAAPTATHVHSGGNDRAVGGHCGEAMAVAVCVGAGEARAVGRRARSSVPITPLHKRVLVASSYKLRGHRHEGLSVSAGHQPGVDVEVARPSLQSWLKVCAALRWVAVGAVRCCCSHSQPCRGE